MAGAISLVPNLDPMFHRASLPAQPWREVSGGLAQTSRYAIGGQATLLVYIFDPNPPACIRLLCSTSVP